MHRLDALTQTLILAIAAPNEAFADRLSAIAEHLAEGLSPALVDKCKADAAAWFGTED